MEWDTRRWRRDKSWKLYRKTQYREKVVKKQREPKNGEHWRYSPFRPVLRAKPLPYTERLFRWMQYLSTNERSIGKHLYKGDEIYKVLAICEGWLKLDQGKGVWFHVRILAKDYTSYWPDF